LAFAEKAVGRGKEETFDLILTLMDVALSRLARTGVLGQPPQTQAAPHESTVLARLAPNAAAGRAWANLAQQTGDRSRHGRAVNVDAASLIYDALLTFREALRPALP
jgi:DNA polymerase-3 subunit delta'